MEGVAHLVENGGRKLSTGESGAAEVMTAFWLIDGNNGCETCSTSVSDFSQNVVQTISEAPQQSDQVLRERLVLNDRLLLLPVESGRSLFAPQ